jgi:hypothetical protein
MGKVFILGILKLRKAVLQQQFGILPKYNE